MPSKTIHKDQVEIIESTMNSKILSYSSKNNHEELTDSLEQLVSKVNEYRDSLRENGNW